MISGRSDTVPLREPRRGTPSAQTCRRRNGVVLQNATPSTEPAAGVPSMLIKIPWGRQAIHSPAAEIAPMDIQICCGQSERTTRAVPSTIRMTQVPSWANG